MDERTKERMDKRDSLKTQCLRRQCRVAKAQKYDNPSRCLSLSTVCLLKSNQQPFPEKLTIRIILLPALIIPLVFALVRT